MKALLIGASGMLGSNLLLEHRDHTVVPTYWQHPVHHGAAARLDITNQTRVRSLMAEVGPQVVINLAAMSKPAECQEHPELAYAVNVIGALHVARAAREVGARLIHLSTDLVFDEGSEPRTEDSPPNPLSVYGRTKAEAEEAISDQSTDWAVLRISVLYGWSGLYTQSFAEWVLAQLREGKEAQLYVDQWRNLTYIPDVVAVIWEMAARRDPLNAILHVAGPSSLTRYAFGRRVAEAFGLPPRLVREARFAETPGAAYTPSKVILDTKRMSRIAQTEMRAVEVALADMVQREAAGYRDRLAAL